MNCWHPAKLGGGNLYFLDTYNQAVHEDIVTAIRTNINTANHHFILERKDEPDRTDTA